MEAPKDGGAPIAEAVVLPLPTDEAILTGGLDGVEVCSRRTPAVSAIVGGA